MAPFAQTTVPAHIADPRFKPGRPSDYRPEYDDAVIDYMAQGYSLTAFAGSILQARDTVYEWIKRHPSFSDAVHRARSARVAALEIKLLNAKRGAQAATSIFALKNADPVEWKEVRNVTHEHSLKLDQLTDAQLYAIAAAGKGSQSTVIEGESVRVDTSK